MASVGGDKSVFLWDVSTGRIIRKFSGHTTRINCVRFNAESTLLFTGAYDRHVRIWDCKSNMFQSIQVLTDATDSISDIVLHETELITSSIDGCIRTYDIRRGVITTDSCTRKRNMFFVLFWFNKQTI